ncbi:hypothetical protein QRX50_38385 [Amycolatopsis carbonis]|uniref:DUF4126 domain-containing protein n=1 Tax=Amycolatopsis carbonis TaxID=715471 RepID=A0A9Y2IEU0_9PSEU|nr:hypothetical protein [Amycolatopsis sp. 2-15]WIX77223.1 hypothetical protein QRX50_38385 [Amycolatopsis sp. 2-15]
MADRPEVEVVGVMVGVTAGILSDPLVPWWLFLLIAAGVAALAGGIVAQAVANLPSVRPAVLAGATVFGGLLGGLAGVAVAGSRVNAWQDCAILLSGYVVLRLAGATADRLGAGTNVSLIASLTGEVVTLATVPLLLAAHPQLSIWAVVGIGAGVGWLEGAVTAMALSPGRTAVAED